MLRLAYLGNVKGLDSLRNQRFSGAGRSNVLLKLRTPFMPYLKQGGAGKRMRRAMSCLLPQLMKFNPSSALLTRRAERRSLVSHADSAQCPLWVESAVVSWHLIKEAISTTS